MGQLSKIALAIALVSATAWALAAAQTPASSPASAAPAAAASQPAAQLVTVKVDSLPLREALAQVQAQTGQLFSFVGPPDDTHLVSLSFDGVPMWDALRGILDAAGPKQSLSVQSGPDTGARTTLSGRWSTHGPFLVLANAVRHDIDYRRNDDALERVWLEVLVAADPGVRIAYIEPAATPSTAIADNGASLVPASIPPSPAAQVVITRTPVHSVRLNLQPPTPAPGGYPHSIKLLQGVIPGAVVAKSQAIELPVLDSIDQELDGVTISIKSTQQSPTMYTLEIKFAASDVISTDDWKAWSRRIPATVAKLRDGDGKETILLMNTSTISTRYNTVRGQVKAPASAAGAKFVIEVPTELQEVAVPYRFEDLPLP